jgi:hypothetical protein
MANRIGSVVVVTKTQAVDSFFLAKATDKFQCLPKEFFLFSGKCETEGLQANWANWTIKLARTRRLFEDIQDREPFRVSENLRDAQDGWDGAENCQCWLSEQDG